ncbi:hypothetical protein FDP41_000771 [Naegleria fowleri]|uniref:PCI domain-containing protein n=1 Tax=Naegleria fowleri TaxID=5763 RepID=A0A6A5CCR1_NAEFO|nr:uncharacterized protein FDP41_000771 [Naegleria fowleri]KAF0984872.1 hypothetical protein FDP41_000771 [Naegleria fowleri]CAG4714699.1 unnamed protein product [Naegleria fowleri]
MSSFDLDQYISGYSGLTKVKRLQFIVENSKELRSKALVKLIDLLKTGKNTTLYKEVIEKYGKEVGQNLDTEWIAQVDRAATKQQEKLEVELNAHKTNLIKESIRVGHNDLGDFHLERGNLQESLKSYLRTRDYCTSSKHVNEMCLNVIRVSIEMGNYALVNQYVTKAENTPDVSDGTDVITTTKILASSALANLEGKKYKIVARKLLDCDIQLENSFNDVITCSDIAVYAGLTALATFDRRELKEKVLSNNKYRGFLELEPDISNIINCFYESKYTACLESLDKLLPRLLLDIYLRDHVSTLYEKIRSKALVQYVSTFTSVDMNKMAVVFNTTVENLEKEIAALIMDKQIKARIDSHKKILYARVTDIRNATYQKALEMGEQFIRESEAAILRMNVNKQRDFVIKPNRKAAKQMMF